MTWKGHYDCLTKRQTFARPYKETLSRTLMNATYWQSFATMSIVSRTFNFFGVQSVFRTISTKYVLKPCFPCKILQETISFLFSTENNFPKNVRQQKLRECNSTSSTLLFILSILATCRHLLRNRRKVKVQSLWNPHFLIFQTTSTPDNSAQNFVPRYETITLSEFPSEDRKIAPLEIPRDPNFQSHYPANVRPTMQKSSLVGRELVLYIFMYASAPAPY